MEVADASETPSGPRMRAVMSAALSPSCSSWLMGGSDARFASSCASVSSLAFGSTCDGVAQGGIAAALYML